MTGPQGRAETGLRSTETGPRNAETGPRNAETGPRNAETGPRNAETGRWTVLELLRWTTGHFEAHGIETARLDAECLLAAALGVERLRLYIDFEKPVLADERAAFRELVQRRAGERVPVALLVGRREFWSLSLRVTADTLVPRPETETLVRAALDLLPDPDAPARVLDVGTGTGAVALAIARERPKTRVTATDVSPKALEIARENADELGMSERICLLEGNLFEPVAGERFDLIVSNPPYLALAEREGLAPELAHEPPGALFADADGSAVLRSLVDGIAASDVLAPGGGAAFELAPAQAPVVSDWCRRAGLLDVTTYRDLGQLPRVVALRKPASAARSI